MHAKAVSTVEPQIVDLTVRSAGFTADYELVLIITVMWKDLDDLAE